MTSSHTRVGVGTRFVYNGELIEVVELHSAGLGLGVIVKDRAGRLRRIALSELMFSDHSRIVADSTGPASDDPQEIAATVMAMLTTAGRQHVAERADHVREVLTGFRSGTPDLARPGEPLADYSSTAPMMRRYEAKANELGMRPRSIQRWVSLYRAAGEAGLASKRDVRRECRRRRDDRFSETALEVMVESTELSKPSGMKVIMQAAARASARYGDGAVWIPSRATAYRQLAKLEKKHPTLRLSTKRNRDIADRPQGAYGKLRPARPGEYVVMDCTNLDVFAIDPLTLKAVGCRLTVAMDWYSRCVTGVRLTPVAAKSFDAASVLYQTFRPPPAKPWWPKEAVWPELGIPRSVLIECEAFQKRANTASGPSLVPEAVVIDHESIFVSEHLNGVCQRLGISVQPARLRKGRDKGPLERFFLTLRHDLLQFLPGYKGNEVSARGVAPESDAVFYIDQLEDLIREWVATVYHVTAHDGLCEPGLDALDLSPADMFERGVACAGFIEAPRDPDLAFEFLQVVKRAIQPAGVQWKNRVYNDCEHNVLRDHAGRQSPYGGPGDDKWPISVNPDDITKVYFRDAKTRKWHTLVWEHAPSVPMSEDGLQWARKRAREKYQYPDDRLAIADLLKRWHIPLEMTPTERRIALRLNQSQSWLARALSTDDDDTPLRRTKAIPVDGARLRSDDDLQEADSSDVPQDRRGVAADEDDFYADAWEVLQ